jgi:hypothetical protein
MLASQYLDRVSTPFTDVPERRLLVAVLADAARCLQVGGKPRAEVLVWVRGQKGAARLSFRFLCDGLGMEVASTTLAPSCRAPLASCYSAAAWRFDS